MRITKISVRKLFGIPTFNYDIELKLEERITIIHGPNGSGKTVLFKMIDGLFNENYFIFWKYPFHEFTVYFDNGENISVSRPITEKEIDFDFPPTIRYSQIPDEPFVLKIDERLFKSLPPSIRRKINPDKFEETIDFLMGEPLSRNDPRFPYVEYPRAGNIWYLEAVQLPTWLIDLSKKLNVIFIDTNRLLINKPGREDRSQNDSYVKAIQQNSEDLSTKVQEIIFRADAQSKRLDSSFPSRIVENVQQQTTSQSKSDTIKNRLEDLQDKRKSLVGVGLLDEKTESEFSKFRISESVEEDKTLLTVLELYVEDTEQKLAVYQELAKKIELYKAIVQSVLRNKVLHISREGFEIRSVVGRSIPLGELSSGEQHLLVLLYKLLFRKDEKIDELVLIDEPEISLHIAWQMRFVDDLIRINELSKFDVMIATHSPNIVNARRDLMVVIGQEVDKSE